MITYAELMALSVFVGMGCYISYLRHKIEMVIVDILEGNVSIRKERDGFSVHKTERQVTGEV